MAVEPRNTNRDSPVSHTTCWEDFLNELCQPDPLADLIIDVDGHQLHTSKFLLAKVSSKFRQMFTDPGVEQSGILSLPGTGLHAATEFLRWLLPSEISVLSGRNGLCDNAETQKSCSAQDCNLDLVLCTYIEAETK